MKNYYNENLNTLVKTQRKNNLTNYISPTMSFWVKKISKLLLELLLVTWAVFTLVFILFNLISDKPQYMIEALGKASAEEYDQIEENLSQFFHINGSIFNQYFWAIKSMFDGTMGYSWTSAQPVSLTFWSRFGTSVLIGTISMILSLLIGVPTGIYLARRQNKFSDILASIISVFAFSIPSFVIALLIVGINAVLGLPLIFEYGNIYIYLLASLIIAFPVGFGYTRYLRTSIRQEYDEQYVALARVKGVSESKILTKHILKPALFPIVNYLPFLVVGVFFGSITIESVFSIPGTGKMLIDAALEHDQSTLLAITTWYTFFTVISFFVRDLLIVFIDPRVRVE